MVEISITQATLTEIDRLAVLNKYLIEDEGHPNTMNVPQLAERMTGWLQGEYSGYLARRDDRIAAYCLFRDDGDYYYLRQLYVDRDFRRQGIATQLLDWMYANVWTEKKVRLDVLAHNEGAIAFYRHYGFKTQVLRLEK
ncbi:MAG: GNAT family N-acetyltransferase [Anaerolineales bacterium]